MKKLYSLLILMIIFIQSCVLEPPVCHYSFQIINNSDNTIVINSFSIEDENDRIDTIIKGNNYSKRILRLECFTNYNDTLIKYFFKDLKIHSLTADIKKDVYNRKFWVIAKEDIHGGITCNGGDAMYVLTLNNKDFE